MYAHHQETRKYITEKLKKEQEVLALLLTGSIAHGFAKENSDVDILIVVENEVHQQRSRSHALQYYEKVPFIYEGGYIDGKYITLDFMKKVAQQGSEPARFAFEGAQVAFSRIEGLESLLGEIIRYPVEKKEENIERFYAQFEAWNWYCYEAIKHENTYLLQHAVNQLILFGGRLILADNELLYPFHKWFLKVLEQAQRKPEQLLSIIDQLLKQPTKENIALFYETIKNEREWYNGTVSWPNQFMQDSELNWLTGQTPVADV